MRRIVASLCVVASLALILTPAAAQGFGPRDTAPGFSAEPYITNPGTLDQATAMVFAPDGRLFIAQQNGFVRVVGADGTLSSTPVLHVPTDVHSEGGLIGITLDPKFNKNKFLYIHYFPLRAGPGDPLFGIIERYKLNGDVADVSTAKTIVTLDVQNTHEHNGGTIAFGPDNKLYISTGEDTFEPNSQSLSNRLGKILRYNKKGKIPKDNPFFNNASVVGQNRSIWALGLRNPWTFAFHPKTGEMFINDVGQADWEEVNRGIAGANYGWPETEGYTDDPRFVSPVYAYPNPPDIEGCASIIGGAFYTAGNSVYPKRYNNDYFFGDLCSGQFWARDAATGAVTDVINLTPYGPAPMPFPVDVDAGPDGAIYVLVRGLSANAGQVYRLAYDAPSAGELVSNGSFELGANKPADWVMGKNDKGRRVCDGAPAMDGDCSLRLNKGKVKQALDGSGLEPGTQIDVSAAIAGVNLGNNVKVVLKVKTASGKTNYPITIDSGSFEWTTFSLDEAIEVTEPIQKLTLVIKKTNPGRMFIDSVSVMTLHP